jgi:hypothetical protein
VSWARALSRQHGDRYYRWELREGGFTFEEYPVRLPGEKELEGK